METKSIKSTKQKFECITCDYITSYKSNYNKHIATRKHLMETDGNKMYTKSSETEENICEYCGKFYKNRSGLWKHKKSCENKTDYKLEVKNEGNTQKGEKDALIIDLLKKMDEKDKQIMELIPKVGNTTTNNNTQFNLHVFLKEDCKDAINWSEFINSIELDSASLNELKESNITKSISEIVCRKLDELGIYKRPIHCVDQKRKKLCIKNAEDWENEDSTVNALITKGDRKLQHEYVKLIKDWEDANPEWMNNEKLKEEYMELSSKVYQTLDENKSRAELIKVGTIPKI